MLRLEQKIGFCTTKGGVRLAYSTLGNGPPLVKAANGLGHLQFELESPIFRHWTMELSRYHEYVRYDDRGCGLSDRDVSSSTFQDWAHDLETVVDSSGVLKFELLGIFPGGRVDIDYGASPHRRGSPLSI